MTPLPALFFYEDRETPGNVGGRWRRGKNVLQLYLAIFGAFAAPVFTPDSAAWQSFKEWSDALAGKIHGLWYDRSLRQTLRSAGLIGLEEGEKSQAPGSENYGGAGFTTEAHLWARPGRCLYPATQLRRFKMQPPNIANLFLACVPKFFFDPGSGERNLGLVEKPPDVEPKSTDVEVWNSRKASSGWRRFSIPSAR